RRAARVQLRRRPPVLRIRRLARAGAPIPSVRPDALPEHDRRALRPERLRRQRHHRPRRRRARQLPHAVGVLRERPHARSRVSTRTGRAPVERMLRDARPLPFRLATPDRRDPRSRARNHLMPAPFDYIIVGAGSAGCILASRLTEDPSVRVLLVEAGGSDRRLIISMPGALPFVYQNKRLGWGFQSGPEPHLDGRTIDEKQGLVIGGTSSINAMIYNRGNPLDYEGWADEGLPDWSYAQCLPYFRKMETFVDGENEWRGASGPMKISRARAEHRFYEAFLQSGEQAGHAVTPDHNAFRQEGFHVAQSFIHNGLRWSSSRAYLRPAMSRPNLQLMKTAFVRCILIENGAAVGIEVSFGGTTEAITYKDRKSTR